MLEIYSSAINNESNHDENNDDDDEIDDIDDGDEMVVVAVMVAGVYMNKMIWNDDNTRNRPSGWGIS